MDERVASFVKEAQEQASHFATNHIMFTMGSDFNYQNALEWYKNLDKLVHYVNKMVRSLSLFSVSVCVCVYRMILDWRGTMLISEHFNFY